VAVAVVFALGSLAALVVMVGGWGLAWGCGLLGLGLRLYWARFSSSILSVPA
jgi:hypothetical protein